MEIVMNDTDLIIGVELLEDNIQMCVYDSELKAPVAADTEKDKTLSEWYSAYGLQCFGN